MNFRKNVRGHGKVMEFRFFCPNIPCCLKRGNILLIIEQKYTPKRLGFQHFLLVKENLYRSRKCPGKVIECYCPISVLNLASFLCKT